MREGGSVRTLMQIGVVLAGLAVLWAMEAGGLRLQPLGQPRPVGTISEEGMALSRDAWATPLVPGRLLQGAWRASLGASPELLGGSTLLSPLRLLTTARGPEEDGPRGLGRWLGAQRRAGSREEAPRLRLSPGAGPGGVQPLRLLLPAEGPVTSPFGPRPSPFDGRREFHVGVDIGVPFGSAVRAAGDGLVLFAGRDEGYGQLLVLSHGDGVTTRYSHLGGGMASAGQRVEAGEVIAHVGRSGRTTGAHLHYELWVQGKPLNPRRYLTEAR
ncbi:MAG: M23 family metallopeptidase [Deltaproteobacteria bacterium]|nr:M23 family metallopeptidase [Deltaproteobacteria bacterium]